MQQLSFYAGLMLIAGFGIPMMAALNGGLGAKLQDPPLASAILLTVGASVAMVYLLINNGYPKTLMANNTPWYFYLGGLLVAFYIISITWVAPRFGTANAVSCVLLGQLLAMTIIDHYGLFGALQQVISTKRMMGLLLMASGVLLVLSRPSG